MPGFRWTPSAIRGHGPCEVPGRTLGLTRGPRWWEKREDGGLWGLAYACFGSYSVNALVLFRNVAGDD